VAILANRVKTKNNIIELSKFMLFSFKKFLFAFLILVSCLLLYFSYPKFIAEAVLETAGNTLSIGNFMYSGAINTVKSAYNRFSYFQDLEAENLKLKLEIESLGNARSSESALKKENAALREVLHVVKELEQNFITAKIVSASITPFASSILIQAGKQEGVRRNDIVRGKEGLIGRIIDVSENYSTVMLINDHNSRIPVIAGNSKVRGILAKQGDILKMIYLNENHNIKPGETIYTSGEGKIFSKGIAVATALRVSDKEVIVEAIEKYDNFDFAIVELTLN
jgi:rod shape-determining protein MreC